MRSRVRISHSAAGTLRQLFWLPPANLLLRRESEVIDRRYSHLVDHGNIGGMRSNTFVTAFFKLQNPISVVPFLVRPQGRSSRKGEA